LTRVNTVKSVNILLYAKEIYLVLGWFLHGLNGKITRNNLSGLNLRYKLFDSWKLVNYSLR